MAAAAAEKTGSKKVPDESVKPHAPPVGRLAGCKDCSGLPERIRGGPIHLAGETALALTWQLRWLNWSSGGGCRQNVEFVTAARGERGASFQKSLS